MIRSIPNRLHVVRQKLQTEVKNGTTIGFEIYPNNGFKKYKIQLFKIIRGRGTHSELTYLRWSATTISPD